MTTFPPFRSTFSNVCSISTHNHTQCHHRQTNLDNDDQKAQINLFQETKYDCSDYQCYTAHPKHEHQQNDQRNDHKTNNVLLVAEANVSTYQPDFDEDDFDDDFDDYFEDEDEDK